MNHLNQKLTLLLALFTTISCSAEYTSSQKDIVTDIDGDSVTSETYLYYVEGSQVTRAQCLEGFPASRASCTQDPKQMSFDAFEAALDDGLREQVTEQETQVENLLSDKAEWEESIDQYEDAIVQLESDIAQYQRNIATDQNTIEALHDEIKALQQQISDIEEEMLSNTNPDLERQLEALEETSTVKQARLNDTIGRKLRWETRLTTANADLATKRSQLASSQSDLAATEAELTPAQARLAQTQRDYNALHSTIAKLENDSIVYSVNGGSSNFDALKPFVKRFDDIMVGQMGDPSRIRLRGSANILEVKVNNVWGPVCDDNFTAPDAKVACRHLGLTYVGHSRGNAGTEVFLMDDVACFGTESNLFSCGYSSTDNCSASEGVSLTCR